MPIVDGLRSTFSVQGVPQKSSETELENTLTTALTQPQMDRAAAKSTAVDKAATTVAATGNRQNVFVTTASLATFPVATGVIVVVWRLLQSLAPNVSFVTPPAPWIPLILALLLGAFMLYMDLSDPERTTPTTRRDIVVKSVIALINSAFLAAAVRCLPGAGWAPLPDDHACW